MNPVTCVIANTNTRSKKSSSGVTRWSSRAACDAESSPRMPGSCLPGGYPLTTKVARPMRSANVGDEPPLRTAGHTNQTYLPGASVPAGTS